MAELVTAAHWRLTEQQRRMLMKFFHQQYGRYPQSEYEFQQWLCNNW